jgi:hypothetical protein
MRNVCGPESRAGFLLVATVAIALVLNVLSFFDFYRFTADQSELRSQGWGIFVAESSDSGIDAASCDALNDLPFVERAGTLDAQGSVTYLQSGQQSRSLWVVSPAFLRNAGATSTTSALFAGPGESTRLSLAAKGGYIGTTTSSALIFPLKLDGPGLGLSEGFVSVARTNTTTTTCIIELQLEAVDALESLAFAQIGYSGRPPSIRRYIDIGELETNPIRRHGSRSFVHVGAAAAALLGAFVALITLTRGSELAVYRLCGFRRQDITGLLLCEAALCSIAAMALSLTVGAFGVALHLHDCTNLAVELSFGALLPLVALPATLAAAFRDPVRHLQDR